jgi:uncharacterized protein (DUF2062 family)
MIHVTKAALRTWLSVLFHTHDTPRRTAAAFGLGVLIGFSPFFGLHTIMAIVLAFVLRLNRVSAIFGAYVNLPWIAAPYYTVSTVVGAWLLGLPLPPQFNAKLTALFDMGFFSEAFWIGVGTLLRPLLWPYFVGSMIGALALGAAAYALAVPAIVAGRRHIHIHHRPPADMGSH